VGKAVYKNHVGETRRVAFNKKGMWDVRGYIGAPPGGVAFPFEMEVKIDGDEESEEQLDWEQHVLVRLSVPHRIVYAPNTTKPAMTAACDEAVAWLRRWDSAHFRKAS
jgi:hypothetical protein